MEDPRQTDYKERLAVKLDKEREKAAKKVRKPRKKK